MHTQEVIVDRIKYYVHHNGDWSGEAIVMWTDKKGVEHEIELPGLLFKVCNNNAVIDDAISALENLLVGPDGKR